MGQNQSVALPGGPRSPPIARPPPAAPIIAARSAPKVVRSYDLKGFGDVGDLEPSEYFQTGGEATLFVSDEDEDEDEDESHYSDIDSDTEDEADTVELPKQLLPMITSGPLARQILEEVLRRDDVFAVPIPPAERPEARPQYIRE